MKRLDWDDLAQGRADSLDGEEVEIAGWMAPPEGERAADYFLFSAEPPGCCLPTDPLAAIEVLAVSRIPIEAGKVALRGTWHVLRGDPTGWRFQLRAARLGNPVTRRRMLASGLIAGLFGHACAPPAVDGAGAGAPTRPGSAVDHAPATGVSDAARAVVAATVTVDIHSHAGSLIGVKRVESEAPFTPLAAPMKAGGMRIVCLAIVADSPTHRVMADRRIHPFREPEPGELYAYGNKGFARLHALVGSEGLNLVSDRAAMSAARRDAPAIVVTAEGADFLDGSADRVDEFHEKWGLRHLQLTHYRVNALGDIQTEDPVHGGLTDAGAAVIKRCNARGIVVDVAHGTFDLVKRAVQVTTKPLVLSHTSFNPAPKSRSRLIDAEHAKLIAGTGGVIGIWPPAGIFPDLASLAHGMARMADIVGAEHIGLGTDTMGLVGPSAFDDYARLPELAQALLDAGFNAEEAGKILGGNYQRVFEVTLT
jgi:membrane dipeptidase